MREPAVRTEPAATFGVVEFVAEVRTPGAAAFLWAPAGVPPEVAFTYRFLDEDCEAVWVERDGS